MIKTNTNLAMNLEFIRTVYAWLSRKTSDLSSTEIMNRFYKYVDEDFYNKEMEKQELTEEQIIFKSKERFNDFVKNASVDRAVAKKLIKSGIPENCMKIDSATALISLPKSNVFKPQDLIEFELLDFIEKKIRRNNFMDKIADNDMKTLDNILSNIPSEKICFLLLLVHHLMKQINFSYISREDALPTLEKLLENATYDPNNKEEVALMEYLTSITQSYKKTYNNPETELSEKTDIILSALSKAKKNKIKMDKADIEISKSISYKIISCNALLLRESCKIIAESMDIGGKKFPQKLYKFLGCSNASYDHFVKNGHIGKDVKQLFINFGIPKKCFDKNDAVLISTTPEIKELLFKLHDLKFKSDSDTHFNEVENINSETDLNEIETVNSVTKTFIDALKDYFFVENPSSNNVLFTSCKKIVQGVYESAIYSPEISEALFDLLEEMELDGTNFKYKDMKKQLEEIANSYYENNLAEKEEDKKQS